MNKVIILGLIALMLITGCKEQGDVGVIGGQRDDYGCLGPAGYSWNEEIGACVRQWELNEDTSKAAKIAVEGIDSDEVNTINEVILLKCPGCFQVKIIQGTETGDTIPVEIRDWKVYTIGVSNFKECVAAGNAILESYPRQCSSGGEIFIEEVKLDMTEELCKEAAGHWNECGSKCTIENQGNERIMCAAVCDLICECGGIAGWNCPEGFSCNMPSGIPDALGYCE